ncbi:MAG: thiamine phosphate synthase [Burkholderiales bacterium]|nr:thiamine phosphate synthase [Burkholderiales bacterium]
MKPAIKGLYAITPETGDTAQLLDKTRAALAGGAQWVQYRSKSADVALKHEQATELLELCRDFHAPLIVNDDVRLAALIEADGVHVGEDDARLIEARINLGPDKIIGVSCYQDLARALRFEAEGADYVAFGSFYPSATKPGARPCPLSLLVEAKTQLHLPVVAIGGITLANAQSLIDAGADAIAVISALFDTPNVEACAQAFSSLFATRH